MRATNAGIMATVMVAGLCAAGAAMADNAALLKEAKISEAKAREIALKQAPGTVKSSELEKEKGTLVWSFDITNAKGGGITARDGHIVETKAETAKDEAAEKAKEAKEAKKTTKHKASKHTTH